MNTPTPETDSHAILADNYAREALCEPDCKEVVNADFARKLERERDELRHKIATDFMAGVVIELTKERDEARKEASRAWGVVNSKVSIIAMMEGNQEAALNSYHGEQKQRMKAESELAILKGWAN